MKEAIRLSMENIQNGHGGPFGAVIVKDGKIISKAVNKVIQKNDPTAHAEIEAIRIASKKLNNFNLKECVIYTSCEPCPMCLSAIYWARIKKIYYANTRKDAAEISFDDEQIYNEFSIPHAERKIPMIQYSRDEAIKVFKAWEMKTDKIIY
ncbi:MAG: nucleoside deaminase [Bacteroidetes bacterium]|nr:nucleoside deaminase [Bacteroidota bacterium]